MSDVSRLLAMSGRPLVRCAYMIAHGVRVAWWRIVRPHIRGCRIIALDGQGRVLLVRHTYGSGRWTTPGGGLASKEDAIAGALRELVEEVGLDLVGAVPIVELVEHLHGATNHVVVVGGRVLAKPRVDGREISKAAFFRLERLPDALSRHIRKGLPVWVAATIAASPVSPPKG